MSEEAKSNVGRIALGALCAVCLGLAVLMFLPPSKPAPTALTAVLEPAPIIVTQAPTVPEPAPVVGPQFDTFRVEPNGVMVIAGRAKPGQVVDIILAGEAIDRVTANGSGSFVAFPLAGPSQEPRRLSLLGDPDGAAVASDTSYMVAPIVVAQAGAPGGAIIAPLQAAATTEPIVTAPAPPISPDVDAAIGLAPAAPVAPMVLQADADGIRVIQSGSSAPRVAANVALDAITYDPAGEVLLSGRATANGAVRIYLDNRPITTSPVQQGGDWRVDLPGVDTGVYTLRIDEVDTDGTVVSRIETPFKREEAGDVAAVLAEETSLDGFEVAVKTVQPGATLWAIAQENMGSGIFYVEVFEANRDLIKDPDLIYPGQIFRIPTQTQ